MQQFLLRRVSLALLALFALSILTFLLVRPGQYMFHFRYDPDGWEYYEQSPLAVQYARYVNDLSRGDLDKAWGLDYGWGYGRDGYWGHSRDYGWGHSSENVVLERLPDTLRLASLALALSAVLGITLGVLAAINKGSPFDRWSNPIILFGQSMPVFWLGVILFWVFTIHLGWLPTGRGGGFSHMILPAITLAWLPAVVLMKLTRTAMRSSLDSNYVKLARIKGVTEWKIIWKHCLRNVAVSPLISFGLIGGAFMTSLVLTEAIFQWPGAGLLMIQTIGALNYHPMLSGVVLCLGGGFILFHLAVDVLRAFLDPRIRYSETTAIST